MQLEQDQFVIAALLESGDLTGDQVDKVRAEAASRRSGLVEAAIGLRFLTPRHAAIVRAQVSECPFVDLDQYEIEVANAALLPRSIAERHGVFPIFVLGGSACVAMVDPLDLTAADRVREAMRCEVVSVLAEETVLRSLIQRAYALHGAQTSRAESSTGSENIAADQAPIVQAVNQIIAEAAAVGASDVHISPEDSSVTLRQRIDGVLVQRPGPSLSSHPAVVQRIKVMSGLDLTQTRRPQEGKFRFIHDGRTVDVRVSIVPTVHGENVVLRLLAGGMAGSTWESLGLAGEQRRRLEAVLVQPSGMVLAAGPTGSGKTTSLYVALRTLNTAERNLITIEDPVEVRMPMVRQIQVNADLGLSFASALRSVLRQDPDVILVGEIRDEETARIAVQAALTGHMVLSSIHTGDAAGAVARLADLGVPNFGIAAALSGVLAQRLLRRVCDQCARPCEAHPGILGRLAGASAFSGAGGSAMQSGGYRVGAGCVRCGSTGFRGRVGVYELLEVTDPVREAVVAGVDAGAVRSVALGEGMRPMWLDGVEKAQLGLTTLEEVIRLAAGSLDRDIAASAVRLSA